MSNRIQIFVESVAQMGVGKTELEALTQMCKVFLESALEDEANPFDYPDDDNDDEDVRDEDGEDASTLTDHSKTYYDDEVNEYYDTDEKIRSDKSTLGTTLTNAYIQLAPKLLDHDMCKVGDIDNLSNFIDWLLKKYNEEFDKNTALDPFTKNPSYKEERINEVVNVIDKGDKVAQLLKEIKDTFSQDLANASITNEQTIFPVAGDINDFITKKFDNSTDDEHLNAEQIDQNVITREGGFVDIDNDIDHIGDPTEEQLRMAAEAKRTSNDARNKKSASDTQTDSFNDDESLTTVEDAVNDFLHVIPTVGLSESEVDAFNRESGKTKKEATKKLAGRRADFTKKHKGKVIEASALNDDDDPWAGL